MQESVFAPRGPLFILFGLKVFFWVEMSGFGWKGLVLGCICAGQGA